MFPLMEWGGYYVRQLWLHLLESVYTTGPAGIASQTGNDYVEISHILTNVDITLLRFWAYLHEHAKTSFCENIMGTKSSRIDNKNINYRNVESIFFCFPTEIPSFYGNKLNVWVCNIFIEMFVILFALYFCKVQDSPTKCHAYILVKVTPTINELG